MTNTSIEGYIVAFVARLWCQVPHQGSWPFQSCLTFICPSSDMLEKPWSSNGTPGLDGKLNLDAREGASSERIAPACSGYQRGFQVGKQFHAAVFLPIMSEETKHIVGNDLMCCR